MVKKAKVIYSAGFFLTVCPDAMYKVGQFALQEGEREESTWQNIWLTT